MKKDSYIYSVETLSNTVVLKRFEVKFNGQLLPVDLLRLQSSLAPEHFFYVTIGEKKMLVKRTYLNGKQFWIGGGALSHEETQLLGPEIEKQLGYPLPPAESNNPFEYKGDIQITKRKFLLGNIPAEKAKAPYSSNIVYRIYTSTVMVELEKSYYFSKEGQWLLNSPSLQPEHFKALTDLIDLYEGAQDNQ